MSELVLTPAEQAFLRALNELGGDDLDRIDLVTTAQGLERMPSVPDVTFLTLAPDWLCEVLSPSTERIDRGRSCATVCGRSWRCIRVTRRYAPSRSTRSIWRSRSCGLDPLCVTVVMYRHGASCSFAADCAGSDLGSSRSAASAGRRSGVPVGVGAAGLHDRGAKGGSLYVRRPSPGSLQGSTSAKVAR